MPAEIAMVQIEIAAIETGIEIEIDGEGLQTEIVVAEMMKINLRVVYLRD